MLKQKLLLSATVAVLAIVGSTFTATAVAGGDGDPGTVCQPGKHCGGPLDVFINRLLGMLP